MSVVVAAAAIGAVLVAGIFFAFSTFVMGALGRLAPGEGIRAMQAINVVVINPWAMGALFGTGLLCVAAVTWAWIGGGPLRATTLGAALLYVVGCIGVTAACNVPLNDKLAAVAADDAAAHEMWRDYLVRWTSWNHVRTAASLAAGVVLLLAPHRA
ncbi:MAG: DUF1772 domain-containing protein [Planctomycetota bacterium]